MKRLTIACALSCLSLSGLAVAGQEPAPAAEIMLTFTKHVDPKCTVTVEKSTALMGEEANFTVHSNDAANKTASVSLKSVSASDGPLASDAFVFSLAQGASLDSASPLRLGESRDFAYTPGTVDKAADVPFVATMDATTGAGELDTGDYKVSAVLEVQCSAT